MPGTDETVLLPDGGRDTRIRECWAREVKVEGQPRSHDVNQVAGGCNAGDTFPHIVYPLRRSRVFPLDLVRPRHNELLEAHETNELRREEVRADTIENLPVVPHRGLNELFHHHLGGSEFLPSHCRGWKRGVRLTAFLKSRRGELNPRPAPYQGAALPLSHCGNAAPKLRSGINTPRRNPRGMVRTTLCDSPRPQEERAWRVLRVSRPGGGDGAVYGSHGEEPRTPSSPPSRRRRPASGSTSRGTPQARWPKQRES